MSAADFSAISGAPEAVARDYLSRAGDNLELALSNFFERSAQGLQDTFVAEPDSFVAAAPALGFDLLPPRASRTDDARSLRAPVCGLFVPAKGASNDQKEPVFVPLAGARVTAIVCDFAAQVTLEQRFVNSGTSAVELCFRLRLEGSDASKRPLPPTAVRSALTSFSATVDGKTTIAECKEKEEALNAYDDGIAAGHRAFLVEDSEIPDSFSMLIGSIAPGSEATVRMGYVTELLTTTDGHVELLLPTGGSAASTSIAVPFSNQLTGLHVEVTASNSHSEFTTVSLASHNTDDIKTENGAAPVCTNGHRAIAKFQITGGGAQDTRLVFELKHPQNNASVSLEGTNEGGALCLSFRAEVDENKLDGDTPMELIFVVDRSGSMAGSRMRNCQQALQLFLRTLPLRAVKFNIISFGDHFDSLWPSAVLYDDETLDHASSYVASMTANFGGTELLTPLQSILRSAATKTGDGKVIPRQIFVLTDGEVSNTGALVKYVERNVGDHSRVFALGIGAEASRDLVVGLAAAGRGDADFVGGGSENDTIQVKVLLQVRAALKPVLRSLRVDWQEVAALLDDDSRYIYGLDNLSSESTQLPPVFAGQRCVLYARLRDMAARETLGALVAAGKGKICVTAETDSVDEEATDPLERVFTEEHKWEVTFADNQQLDARASVDLLPGKAEADHAVVKERFDFISTLAIVTILGHLSSNAEQSRDVDLKHRLTQMAVTAHIASNFTSFVAVSDADGRAATGGLVPIDVNEAPDQLKQQQHDAWSPSVMCTTSQLMKSNVSALLARDDRLEEILNQSDALEQQSFIFQAKASGRSGSGGGLLSSLGGLARRASGALSSSLSSAREGRAVAPVLSGAMAQEESKSASLFTAELKQQEEILAWADECSEQSSEGNEPAAELSPEPEALMRRAEHEFAEKKENKLQEFAERTLSAASSPRASTNILPRDAQKLKKSARTRDQSKEDGAAFGTGSFRASVAPSAPLSAFGAQNSASAPCYASSKAQPPPMPSMAPAPLVPHLNESQVPTAVSSPPLNVFLDVPVVIDSSLRAVDRLVQLQRADGSWFLDSRLASELGLKREQCITAVEKLCAKVGIDPRLYAVILATALAVVKLQTDFAENESEWSLVVDKANKRIRRFCFKEGVDVGVILQAAADTLRT